MCVCVCACARVCVCVCVCVCEAHCSKKLQSILTRRCDLCWRILNAALLFCTSQGEIRVNVSGQCCGVCRPVGCVVNGTLYKVSLHDVWSVSGVCSQRCPSICFLQPCCDCKIRHGNWPRIRGLPLEKNVRPPKKNKNGPLKLECNGFTPS